jgi:hypothetical protein
MVSGYRQPAHNTSNGQGDIELTRDSVGYTWAQFLTDDEYQVRFEACGQVKLFGACPEEGRNIE